MSCFWCRGPPPAGGDEQRVEPAAETDILEEREEEHPTMGRQALSAPIKLDSEDRPKTTLSALETTTCSTVATVSMDDTSPTPTTGADSLRLLEQAVAAKWGLPDPQDAEAVAAWYGVDVSGIDALQEEFPQSPFAERARFLARKSIGQDVQKAAAALRTYLRWRVEELPTYPPSPPELKLPVWMAGRARDGGRLLLFVASTIDLKYTPTTYAHGIVRLIDASVPREEASRFTLLLDVRGHKPLGYKAHSGFKLWSYMASMCKAIQTYFPERLNVAVLYPMGNLDMSVARLFSALLPESTLKRLVFYYDEKGNEAAAPPSDVLKHFSLSDLSTDPDVRRFFTGLVEEPAASDDDALWV